MKRIIPVLLILIILISGISTRAYSSVDDIAEKRYESGMECFEKQDYEQAFSYFLIAGEVKGYAPAQNMLGICYRDGLGTERDLETAKQYFQFAADQGYPDAKENLSLIEDLLKKEAHVHEWMEATYTPPKTCSTYDKKTVTVVVIHGNGSQKVFTLHTDATTLRNACDEEELIQGENGEYGLYVLTVDGETADESQQQWWGITKGGEEIVYSSVDDTMIEEGDTYEFVLNTGW